MKKLLFALAALATALFAVPALAGPTLVADGITYSLTETSISGDGLTAFFILTISGENTASDTEGGGRTGINAIAFNQPAPGTVLSGVMTSPSDFSFALGGLNSSGCDGSGNFFCFDNTTIPPTPTALLSGPLTFMFNATADTAGVWDDYTTAFKIDWVGSANNYDLVSQAIPVNNCTAGCPPPPPPPPPPPVPEPATWALMLVGFGGIGAAMRRQRAARPKLLQIA